MKRFLIGIMVLGFMAILTALAEENTATTGTEKPAVSKQTKAEKPLTDIAVTGKVTKEESKVKREGDKVKVKFVLTTADGAKITLPETKAEVADLEQYVGKNVKVMAKGTEKKDGKKKIVKLDSIVSAEEVPAAPAEAK